jgi:hypothetical protein
VARTPKCPECGLKPWCKYYEKHFGKVPAEQAAAVVAEPKANAKKAPAKVKKK